MNKHMTDFVVCGHEDASMCDILAQGLIGLIEYSYHQVIPSFLEAQLKTKKNSVIKRV
jgi:hypothetical protein